MGTEKTTNRKTPSWQYSIIAFTVIVLFIALGFAIFKIDFAILLFISWLLAGLLQCLWDLNSGK